MKHKNSECPISHTVLSGSIVPQAVNFNNDIYHQVGGKAEMEEKKKLPSCLGYYYINLTQASVIW